VTSPVVHATLPHMLTVQAPFFLTACAIAIVVASAGANAPRWEKVPDLCRQLRAEGWKAKPDGAGDPTTGELRHVIGRSLTIFICDLRQDLPTGAGAKRDQVEVFMQHGGGRSLIVNASVWAAANRTSTLDAAARTLARVARDISLKLPTDMLERVRQGDDSWSDTIEDLRFDISKTTREQELVSLPDLKPSDVPLVVFKVSIGPDEDEDH
jgi:hypothetical protein